MYAYSTELDFNQLNFTWIWSLDWSKDRKKVYTLSSFRPNHDPTELSRDIQDTESLPCKDLYIASSGIWCQRFQHRVPHIPAPPETLCCEWPG